jgi:hypothetical protein
MTRKQMTVILGSCIVISFLIFAVFGRGKHNTSRGEPSDTSRPSFTTSAPVTTKAQTGPTFTTPDGNTISGSLVSVYQNATSTTTVAVSTNTPTTDQQSPTTTTASTTTVVGNSSLGPLDVAEVFAQAFYTVNIGDTADIWIARLAPYAAQSLLDQLSLPAFDPGVSNKASVGELDEATGSISDKAAELIIMVTLSKYQDGVLKTTVQFPIHLVLSHFADWRVVSYY